MAGPHTSRHTDGTLLYGMKRGCGTAPVYDSGQRQGPGAGLRRAGSGSKQQTTFHAQHAGAGQVGDQPVGQCVAVAAQVAGIDVLDSESRREFRQGVASGSRRSSMKKASITFQRMTGEAVDALFKRGGAGERCAQGLPASSTNGAPWPGMTTSTGRRASISSVSRVDLRPSGLPSSVRQQTPKPSRHSASSEIRRRCLAL